MHSKSETKQNNGNINIIVTDYFEHNSVVAGMLIIHTNANGIRLNTVENVNGKGRQTDIVLPDLNAIEALESCLRDARKQIRMKDAERYTEISEKTDFIMYNDQRLITTNLISKDIFEDWVTENGHNVITLESQRPDQSDITQREKTLGMDDIYQDTELFDSLVIQYIKENGQKKD